VIRRFDALIGAAPTLALLACLVLGGWLAARWFWYFATPQEAPSAPARSRVQFGQSAQTLADAQLFGAAPGGGIETVSNLNVKLKGVFASMNDAPAFAVVNVGAKDEIARTGGEVVPGVVLESVHPEHIMLRRNGSLERVNLEERIAPGGPVALSPRPQRTQPRAAPAPAQPTQRFQRPEPYAPVGDVAAPPPEPVAPPQPAPPQIAPPRPAPPVSAPGPQTQSSSRGLVIQAVPAGGALERFGLQPGDVIRSVNGQPVSSEADIVRIMREQGLQGQYIAEVVRGGTTIPLAVSAAR
jgi:general secretion pathway protein C